MELMTALGYCKLCGQGMIQVDGVAQCLLCASKSNTGSGLVVKSEYPSEADLSALLSKAGVLTPLEKSTTHTKPDSNNKLVNSKIEERVINTQKTLNYSISDALNILKNLSMPKDIKQFKVINKAIKILESIEV